MTGQLRYREAARTELLQGRIRGRGPIRSGVAHARRRGARGAAGAGGARGAAPALPTNTNGRANGDGQAKERQEITVVNKVPATFLFVLKEQFELMKAWLEPITRITAAQDDGLAQVRRSVERLTERYEETIRRLEKSDGVDAEA